MTQGPDRRKIQITRLPKNEASVVVVEEPMRGIFQTELPHQKAAIDESYTQILAVLEKPEGAFEVEEAARVFWNSFLPAYDSFSKSTVGEFPIIVDIFCNTAKNRLLNSESLLTVAQKEDRVTQLKDRILEMFANAKQEGR